MHRWDVESVLGEHVPIPSDLAVQEVESVLANFVPRLAGSGVAEIGGTVWLRTTDTASAWSARVVDGRLVTEGAPDGPCDTAVVVTGTAQDIALTADGAVPLLLVVNGFAGVASGCIDAQNRAQTLQHSPDASRGVAAGFMQLAQQLSATVGIAAATGIALTDGPAQPSARGLGLALGLCAGLIALSLLVSLRRN